jgi:hypothetical protein
VACDKLVCPCHAHDCMDTAWFQERQWTPASFPAPPAQRSSPPGLPPRLPPRRRQVCKVADIHAGAVYCNVAARPAFAEHWPRLTGGKAPPTNPVRTLQSKLSSKSSSSGGPPATRPGTGRTRTPTLSKDDLAVCIIRRYMVLRCDESVQKLYVLAASVC